MGIGTGNFCGMGMKLDGPGEDRKNPRKRDGLGDGDNYINFLRHSSRRQYDGRFCFPVILVRHLTKQMWPAGLGDSDTSLFCTKFK